MSDLVKLGDGELTVKSEPLPPDRNPAAVYLAGLGSEKSRRTMRNALWLACGTLGVPGGPLETPWHKLRYQHVAAIRTYLLEDDLAPASINLVLSALRGVAREAYNLGLMSGEDYQRLRLVKGVRGERLPAGRCLTFGELAALMLVCGKDRTDAGARDAAIIACLYAGGLRRSEVVGLDVASYAPSTGTLTVRGKGNKERHVYLNNGASAALADWLTVRGPEPGPLFLPVDKRGRVVPIGEWRRLNDQTIYDILRKRARQAGMQSFSPHDLRRTFVGDLLDKGADISTVQKLAGHASVTTTQRYDRRPEEAKRKAASLLYLPYLERTPSEGRPLGWIDDPGQLRG